MSINSDNYIAPEKSLWKGRVDSETDRNQFRYHQVVECVDLNSEIPKDKITLLGFASDEGVKRNGGRTGAAKGPDYLRSSMGSLCWHGDEGFCDAGNIAPTGDDLESSQDELGKTVHVLLSQANKPILIGGGHETAYGHYLGISSFLKETNPDAKLGILNIDAHFDLRPHNGSPHSGSPFLQAHEDAEEIGLDLKYFVYGINRDNNTVSLFSKAKELGTEFCKNIDIMNSEKDTLSRVEQFIDTRTHIYLTICLDVFNASIAPGVSALAWNGIDLNHALNVIDLVKKSGKMVSVDICELNPEFDQSEQTAKTTGTLLSTLISTSHCL